MKLITDRWLLYTGFTGLFIMSLVPAVYMEEWLFLLLPFAGLVFYTGWQHREILFLLLLCSLPFSFEYNFTPSLGTDIPDEALMLLTAFVFFGAWLYRPASVPASVYRHPLFILPVLWMGWILLTVCCSTDPVLSAKYFLAKTWYLGAFVLAPLLVFKNKKTILIAAGGLLVSMLLVTLMALIRHSYTGFSFAGINEALTPFFRNHVNYSAMLVCMIPVWLVFLVHTTGKKRKWILLALTLSLLALFFAYARGAWLALLAGALAYWLIRQRLILTTYVVVLLLVTGAFGWLQRQDRYLDYAHDFRTTIFHQDFQEHLVATYKLKDVSTAERFYRWIAGIRMIKDKPVTGYGPNTFYTNYKPYAVPAYKTWVSNNPEHSTVHNYFLLLLIEQGIPGLLFFLLLTAAMLWYAQRIYQRDRHSFYGQLAMVTAVILVMLLTVNFLSDLIETDKAGSLFFLCIPLLVLADIRVGEKKTTTVA